MNFSDGDNEARGVSAAPRREMKTEKKKNAEFNISYLSKTRGDTQLIWGLQADALTVLGTACLPSL